MAFTDQQTAQLKAKLKRRHIRTRQDHDRTLSYIEGWHAIAEANRIFGFDGWDRTTTASSCIWQGQVNGQFACTYAVRVKINVRAGEAQVTREGNGCAYATGSTAAEAYEFALKAAETDATKRALATFGNQFGLSLYDSALYARDQGSAKDQAKEGTSAPRQRSAGQTSQASQASQVQANLSKTGRGGEFSAPFRQQDAEPNDDPPGTHGDICRDEAKRRGRHRRSQTRFPIHGAKCRQWL